MQKYGQLIKVNRQQNNENLNIRCFGIIAMQENI